MGRGCLKGWPLLFANHHSCHPKQTEGSFLNDFVIYKRPSMDCRLWTVDCQLWTVVCRPSNQRPLNLYAFSTHRIVFNPSSRLLCGLYFLLVTAFIISPMLPAKASGNQEPLMVTDFHWPSPFSSRIIYSNLSVTPFG